MASQVEKKIYLKDFHTLVIVYPQPMLGFIFYFSFLMLQYMAIGQCSAFYTFSCSTVITANLPRLFTLYAKPADVGELEGAG